MSTPTTLFPSTGFRDLVRRRGGDAVARCYQCATCSSVCELAAADAPFPRRQMLLAQWGLGDQLAADPAVWLCHRCNDCSVRCPRDARPGDVMAAVRSIVVERLSAPAFMGRLTGNAARTWPLLLGLPILFWVALVYLTTGWHVPHPTDRKIIKEHVTGQAVVELVATARAQDGTAQGEAARGEAARREAAEGEAARGEATGGHGDYRTVAGDETRLVYEEFVPHRLIYAVYFTTAALVLIAIIASGTRFWRQMGRQAPRRSSLFTQLGPVLADIATHRRFGHCDAAASNKWAHFAVLWGFVGAAVTSALLIVAMYVTKDPLPLAQDHPYKILGNISAVLLIAGGVLLVMSRTTRPSVAGASSAFDTFFLSVVVLLIATGVLTELGAFIFAPALACTLYIVHLGTALCLFITFPYSKFAHMVYRTLAMAHERMAGPATVAGRD